MGRAWIGALGTVLALTAVVPPAAAQGRTCRQVLPSDARRILNSRGEEVVYFLDPVRVLCTGGVRLEADSAVMNRRTASVELVGGVVYRDAERQLYADWANYLGRNDQLLARGNVVLRGSDGTTVRGADLNYLRETADRPRSRTIIRGDRPHAVIPPTADTAAEPADSAVATEVRADQLEISGEDVLTGSGDVDIQRGTVFGHGDRGRFDQAGGSLTLTGSAWVQDADYRLEGERIDAALSDGDLRQVDAVARARIRSDELDVGAERIRMGFREGELERMEAWNPEPEEAMARAHALAEDFRLHADSIDARVDSVGLQEVRAVGRAYGERGAGTGGGAVSRDWVQGDTITGHFTRVRPEPTPPPMVTEAPPAVVTGDTLVGPLGERVTGGDTTRVVLERIVVVGGGEPALSLYRQASEEPGQPPSVNFMQASGFTLFLEGGDVVRVEATGPIEGLYLEPGAAGARGAETGQEPGGSGRPGS